MCVCVQKSLEQGQAHSKGRVSVGQELMMMAKIIEEECSGGVNQDSVYFRDEVLKG